MLDTATVDCLRRLILAGVVAALVACPPCETWTAARCREPRKPPPMRTAEHPWGLPCLSVGHLRQLVVGNRLMAHTLSLIATAIASQVPVVMEHPRARPEAHMASIWKTAQMAAVRSLTTQLDEVHFFQGDLGQASPKPNTLLIYGVPMLRGALQRHQVAHHLRPGPLVPDQHGRLPTACLKAFPAGLNTAIAEAIIRSLPPRNGTSERPWQSDLDRIEEIHGCAAATAETAMGPDYVQQGRPANDLEKLRA